MAEKVRFLIPKDDVLKSATVTASSATSGLPEENVQDNLIRKVYRSTDNSNEWVKFDCGAATTINCLFIGNHNLTLCSTVKWQGHASDSWASPSLDTTLTVATDAMGNNVVKIAHFYAANQSYRWWRLYLEPGTGNATKLDIGRIMAGRYIQPTRNIRDGFSISTQDPSRGRDTVGRQAYWTTRRQFSELGYNVSRVGEDQLDEFLGLYAEVGRHTAFVVGLDPDSKPTHNTFYVQIMNDVSRTQQVVKQFTVNDVTMQEKI